MLETHSLFPGTYPTIYYLTLARIVAGSHTLFPDLDVWWQEEALIKKQRVRSIVPSNVAVGEVEAGVYKVL